LTGHPIDTVILGCTHYPILRPALKKAADRAFDREVTLLDSAQATADDLDGVLTDSDLRSPEGTEAELDFMFTDVSPAFVDTAERFFGSPPDRFTHVDITDIGPPSADG
jgi:glutamate racemase